MSCIFCRIISGEIPSRTVSATDLAVAFMDAFPLAPGHTLVVPREHRERIQDMTAPEVSEVFGLAARLVSKTDSLAGSTCWPSTTGPGRARRCRTSTCIWCPEGTATEQDPYTRCSAAPCACQTMSQRRY